MTFPFVKRFGQNYQQAVEPGHENEFHLVGDIAVVRPLSNDVGSDAENEFLVDAEMWRRLPWSCWSVSRNDYVQCCGVMLHQVVAYLSGVEFRRDTVIDHKNRNRLDNRLENLRPCTAIENGWNNERRHGHQLKNGKWRFTFSKSFPTYQDAEDEIRLGRFHHMSKNRTCFITETFDSYEEGYQWWKFQAGMHYGEFSPFANPYRSCREIVSKQEMLCTRQYDCP